MDLQVDSIEQVFPLADFIAEVYGELNEVVVHDVSHAENSIVYIRNGRLSGRKVGDGPTDLALKIIQEGRHSRAPYIANYVGKSLGGRRFRCATFFVRNRVGELIGLLCVNVDVTCFDGVISALKMLKGEASEVSPAEEPASALSSHPFEETLQGDPKQTIARVARTVLASFPVEPERLSREERFEALRRMTGEGIFLMKGAVPIVAEELRISTPTLYKYLQALKE